jgi:tRNA modification GTPase
LVVYLFDVASEAEETLLAQQQSLQHQGLHYVLVGNKSDQLAPGELPIRFPALHPHILSISAREKTDIGLLRQKLFDSVHQGILETENTIVTNVRHQEALLKVAECLRDIEAGMDQQLSGDLLALDIRRCLYYLGTITGQVEVDRDILGTIFGKFCIGK